MDRSRARILYGPFTSVDHSSLQCNTILTSLSHRGIPQFAVRHRAQRTTVIESGDVLHTRPGALGAEWRRPHTILATLCSLIKYFLTESRENRERRTAGKGDNYYISPCRHANVKYIAGIYANIQKYATYSVPKWLPIILYISVPEWL